MESFKAMYGNASCTAIPENGNGQGRYCYFYVSLDKDPGIGPMSFPHIGRSQLKFEVEPPEAMIELGDGSLWPMLKDTPT